MLSWIQSSVHFCPAAAGWPQASSSRPPDLLSCIRDGQKSIRGGWKGFKCSLKVVFTYMLEDSDDREQKCEKVNGEYHSGVFLLLINVIK